MVAQALYTVDKGVNWDQITGPFAALEDALSAVCFAVNKDTSRWLITRGPEAAPANPAEVSYTDDSGYNWTAVDVEAAGTRAANDSGALFALDRRHVWLVTTGGYIFFSDDGGETWTAQSEATITTEDLNEVHFVDENNGMAVGDAGKVLKTSDGGTTWAEVTDVTGVPNVYTVQMLDSNMALVGTADGRIYMTFNGGTTWTQKYIVAGGSVDAIHAINTFVIWAVSNTAGSVGSVIRSRNGGYSWEAITTPTNTGLNSIHGLDANRAWAVGEDGEIVKVNG
jgi:photosystem II stability/assembly factor-like uncharacterized protein